MKFPIPTISNPIEIDITKGDVVVFVGANGAGKSRLGYYIEKYLFNKTITGHNELQSKITQHNNKLQALTSELEKIKSDTHILRTNPDVSVNGKIIDEIERMHYIRQKQGSFKKNLKEINIHLDELASLQDQLKEFDPNAAHNFQFCHRISALRSIVFGTTIPQMNFDELRKYLLHGSSQQVADTHPKWTRDVKRLTLEGHFHTDKQSGVGVGIMQNDFEILAGALMAEEMQIASKLKQGVSHAVNESTLDKVINIWNNLLKLRKMSFDPDNRTINLESNQGISYNLIDSSEGERTIFYILGQCMLCVPNSLIVIDEPDLYINGSILEELYDRIEKARSDCAFVYITHNLNFASSRNGEKYAVFNYDKRPNPSNSSNQECWDIANLEHDHNVPESVYALVSGSRKNILFVEGTGDSLEKIYSSIYPNFKIIHVGSCSNVISYTKSLNANNQFHRVQCYGIVDGDNRDANNKTQLSQDKVYCLDVAILENIFILPGIAEILFDLCGEGGPLDREQYTSDMIQHIKADQHWLAKNIKEDLSSRIKSQVRECKNHLDELRNMSISVPDIKEIVDSENARIDGLIDSDQSPESILRDLLSMYRTKSPLLDKLAKTLSVLDTRSLKQRILNRMHDERLRGALTAELPSIPE